MLRVVAAQVWRRRGRTLAVVAAIVVAAVSFSLLTSAVATSRLQVTGTVEANYRSAYDILVRPPASRTDLERSDKLVRNNFLSGIFGGISMADYREIAKLPGVEVAAPVAMVGYFLPTLYLPIRIDDLVTDERQQLYRIRQTWINDRGLSAVPDRDRYIYVTGQPVQYNRYGEVVSQFDPVSGRRLDICSGFGNSYFDIDSPFEVGRQADLICYSTTPPEDSKGLAYDWFRPGQIGVVVMYPFPLLLAAVDPVQEARLVGLDDAMVDGSYLDALDRPRGVWTGPGKQGLKYRQVPVIMPDRAATDERLRLEVSRLQVREPSRVPSTLAAPGARRWLLGLSGPTVRTQVLTNTEMYPRVLEAYQGRLYQATAQYWSADEVEYQRTSKGRLQPVKRRNDSFVWTDPRLGFYAPQPSGDVGFRRLTVHTASNEILGNTMAAPTVRAVGVFDPDRIQGFSGLSKLPLTTYTPPDAAPGDARTEKLLGGRSLLPNSNLAGYLQQPPMMLTNLRSLRAFTDPIAYRNLTTTLTEPLSVIRIRVAGVTGPDEASQERVRIVAERILRTTGLDVDITIGSSPEPQLIELPAGQFGRPDLTLREGWSRKGVAVALLQAVDRKSVALFGLVLVVCVLFLLNATIAAVRSRRSELGVLATLGWPARRIFTLLQAELILTGLVAGLVGTGLAAAAATVLDLPAHPLQLSLITPVATALAALAGAWPAWKASHTIPLEAIRPAVRAPRRAATVTTITRLGLVGLARWPGRTLLGAASLCVGVGALAVLVAIQTAFQGQAVGTLLGDAVAVQVRGVDYLAAALTVVLGAFAVADVAYLNITERTDEIGTLRASGWAENHVRRLFATEATATAALGALAGAALGLTLVATLLPIGVQPAITAAATAVATGLLAAIIAIAVPLARTNTLAPAAAIANE